MSERGDFAISKNYQSYSTDINQFSNIRFSERNVQYQFFPKIFKNKIKQELFQKN